MENLKSGDVPALVTNLELMNILSKRLTARREEEEAAATLEHGSSSVAIANGESTKRKNGKLRHRDYIEQSVYEYLAHSPCSNTDVKKMPELVSKLRGGRNGSGVALSRNRRRRTVSGGLKVEEDETNLNMGGQAEKLVKTEEGAVEPVEQVIETKPTQANIGDSVVDSDNYGLTDSETLQILNLMPTEPVEIHLMIEDLSSRLNEDEQNNLLELISKYAGAAE